MANGEQPPVRDDSNQSLRLTAGMLRILNRQVRIRQLYRTPRGLPSPGP